MDELSQIIIQHIKQEGPISFREFMEKSLYYPGLGYYNSSIDQIGKSGDYYTSCSLTPAFGATIARQIRQMWDLSGEENFMIVEYGAGTGFLCQDILDYFKNYPEYYANLRYCIIEKSPVMRTRQKNNLRGKVAWYDSIKDIGEVSGCILSNELIDNFSVHQVVMEEELMEIFIGYTDEFIELRRPANDNLKQYFRSLGVQLPPGFRTEINLEALEWLSEIATCLKKGFVLTIDYGATTAELYAPRKRCGTLLCYNKHTVNDHPFNDIGRQDITSHVNFSALYHWGLQYGLEFCGYTNQAHFLLALGFKTWLRELLGKEQDLVGMVKKESFLTQQLLVDMGSKFKVLIQRKGIPDYALLGFKLS